MAKDRQRRLPARDRYDLLLERNDPLLQQKVLEYKEIREHQFHVRGSLSSVIENVAIQQSVECGDRNTERTRSILFGVVLLSGVLHVRLCLSGGGPDCLYLLEGGADIG